MIHRTAERWRPPLFSTPTTRLSRFTASLRRFLDLQAGSIWRDLAAELSQPHGTVLDVGCGAQPYRRLVNSGDRYIGIDIAAAREYFGYQVPDTLYYEGDIWPVDDAEFPNGRNDAEWMKHTLWYSEGNRLDYKPVNLTPQTVESIAPKVRTF